MSGATTFEKGSNSPYIGSRREDDLSLASDAEDLVYVSKSSGSDENATPSGGQAGKKEKKDKKGKKDKAKKKDKEKAKKEKQVRC